MNQSLVSKELADEARRMSLLFEDPCVRQAMEHFLNRAWSEGYVAGVKEASNILERVIASEVGK